MKIPLTGDRNVDGIVSVCVIPILFGLEWILHFHPEVVIVCMILHDIIENSGTFTLTKISKYLNMTESFDDIRTSIKNHQTIWLEKSMVLLYPTAKYTFCVLQHIVWCIKCARYLDTRAAQCCYSARQDCVIFWKHNINNHTLKSLVWIISVTLKLSSHLFN